ncbi:hypothetical protein ACFORO_17255 [Amycolatopsis halotolerans]|uniref:Uncharacterized protein n=1 Tax=Amycolatopsis halotolerans TaxID=330083 RepID=A0ABV7QJ99_9PSEU
MNDDTVRHLWSDAELDEALAALHPHEAATDRAELDRARASMMRAAAAVSESDEPVAPQRKQRSGAWRWIAVAAAVALVTGGVVVVRELASAPSTLAPAGPGSSTDRREAGAPFTHVVTKYSRTAWVEGRSAFTIREQLDLWIPANPAGTWKGRWTRSSPPELITGKEKDSGGLPGPSQYEESAPGGRFTQNLPFPSRSPSDFLSPGWYHPTPEFVASLPTNASQLTARLFTDLNTPQPPEGDGPMPQPMNYSGTPQFPSRISYPEGTAMILNVFASGYASRELRAALLSVMDKPGFGFTPMRERPDVAQYTASSGLYYLLVSVDPAQAQLTNIQVTARNKNAGVPPGTLVSSAQFSFETTERAGD